MPARPRRTWLWIAFAITALCAAGFHGAEFFLQYQKPNYYRSAYGLPTAHSTAPGPNYSQIEEGLWMGGSVPQPPPGTQAVLNLCEVKDAYQTAFRHWEPIHDGPPAPTIAWLQRQVDFIESERNAGHGVYVHCAAGVSRSGMVMTAYLMRRDGWSAAQAIEYLRKKRPCVSPNPAFTPLLAEWEKSLKAHPEAVEAAK